MSTPQELIAKLAAAQNSGQTAQNTAPLSSNPLQALLSGMPARQTGNLPVLNSANPTNHTQIEQMLHGGNAQNSQEPFRAPISGTGRPTIPPPPPPPAVSGDEAGRQLLQMLRPTVPERVNESAPATEQATESHSPAPAPPPPVANSAQEHGGVLMVQFSEPPALTTHFSHPPTRGPPSRLPFSTFTPTECLESELVAKLPSTVQASVQSSPSAVAISATLLCYAIAPPKTTTKSWVKVLPEPHTKGRMLLKNHKTQVSDIRLARLGDKELVISISRDGIISITSPRYTQSSATTEASAELVSLFTGSAAPGNLVGGDAEWRIGSMHTTGGASVAMTVFCAACATTLVCSLNGAVQRGSVLDSSSLLGPILAAVSLPSSPTPVALTASGAIYHGTHQLSSPLPRAVAFAAASAMSGNGGEGAVTVAVAADRPNHTLEIRFLKIADSTSDASPPLTVQELGTVAFENVPQVQRCRLVFPHTPLSGAPLVLLVHHPVLASILALATPTNPGSGIWARQIHIHGPTAALATLITEAEPTSSGGILSDSQRDPGPRIAVAWQGSDSVFRYSASLSDLRGTGSVAMSVEAGRDGSVQGSSLMVNMGGEDTVNEEDGEEEEKPVEPTIQGLISLSKATNDGRSSPPNSILDSLLVNPASSTHTRSVADSASEGGEEEEGPTGAKTVVREDSTQDSQVLVAPDQLAQRVIAGTADAVHMAVRNILQDTVRDVRSQQGEVTRQQLNAQATAHMNSIKSQIPGAVSKGLQAALKQSPIASPEAVKAFTAAFVPHATAALVDVLANTVVPAHEAATRKMFEQIQVAFEKGVTQRLANQQRDVSGIREAVKQELAPVVANANQAATQASQAVDAIAQLNLKIVEVEERSRQEQARLQAQLHETTRTLLAAQTAELRQLITQVTNSREPVASPASRHQQPQFTHGPPVLQAMFQQAALQQQQQQQQQLQHPQQLQQQLQQHQQQYAPPSHSHTPPAPSPTHSGHMPQPTPAMSDLDRRVAHINTLQRQVESNDIEGALLTALESSDLEVVTWLCGKLNPAILASRSAPVSQQIRLSLIQQLSCSLSSSTALKSEWIYYALSGLMPRDPSLIGHVMPVMGELGASLQSVLSRGGLLHTTVDRLEAIMSLSRDMMSHSSPAGHTKQA